MTRAGVRAREYRPRVAHSIVLFLHSWVRWFVVLSALLLFGRSVAGAFAQRPWSRLDDIVRKVFFSTLHVQIVLGLLLYFVLSPVTPTSLADLRAFMPNKTLRLFAIEHSTGMLLAATSAHLGWTFSNRTTNARARQRRLAIGIGLALVAIALSIPWPWLLYGRPLVREL
jgi:hypothetical protein